jgi:hypothetical protein
LALEPTHALSPEVKKGHGMKLTNSSLCNVEEELMEL